MISGSGALGRDYIPKSRNEFWTRKFDSNVARDRLVTRTLRKAGWKIIRIWECELAPRGSIRAIGRIELALKKPADPG